MKTMFTATPDICAGDVPGLSLGAIRARVRIAHDKRVTDDLVASLLTMPGVQALATVTGEHGLIASVEARDTSAVDALLDRIGKLDGVLRTRSAVVLSLRRDR